MSARLLDQLLGADGAPPAGGILAQLRLGRPNGVGGSSLGLIAAITHDALGAERETSPESLHGDAFARIAVQAVISAARSDQRLSAAELAAMAAELDGLELDADARDILREELRRPPMLDHMTRGLRTREQTVAVYAAALLATDPVHPLSRHYLQMLAARLGLEQALTDRTEAAVKARR